MIITEKRKKIALVLLINIILAVILFAKFSPVFATNDDYRMRLIISGQYSGTPSVASVFMQLPFTWFLSMLYKVNSNFEWYGVIFILLLIISFSVVHFVMISRAKDTKSLVIVNLIYLLVYLSTFSYHLIAPQFTIVSATLCMAAIAILYHLIDKIDNNEAILGSIICLIVFMVLSFWIRMKVFLLLSPFLLIVLLLKWKSILKVKKQFILSIVALVIILGGSFVTHNMYYQSESYKTYSNFNVSRSEFYDFESQDDYDSYYEFYLNIGVSEDIYKIIRSRSFDIVDSLDQDMLSKMSTHNQEVIDNQQNRIDKILDTLDKSLDSFSIKKLRVEMMSLILLFFTSIILFLLKKNYRVFVPVALAIIYMFIGAFVTVYMGRIMDRINQSLILGAVVIILIEMIPMFDFKLSRKIVLGFMAILTLISVFILGKSLSDNELYGSYLVNSTENLDTLTEYASNNPENFYFYNALDFIGNSQYVFDYQKMELTNIESLGNWYVYSPEYYIRNEMFGFDTAINGLVNNENVYYVELNEYHPSFDEYIERVYNADLVLHDTIKNDKAEINVYKIVRR